MSFPATLPNLPKPPIQPNPGYQRTPLHFKPGPQDPGFGELSLPTSSTAKPVMLPCSSSTVTDMKEVLGSWKEKRKKTSRHAKKKKYISISLRKRTSFGKPAKRVTNTFLGNARGKRGSGAFPSNKLKKHNSLSLPLPFFGGGTTWRIRVRDRKVWCFLNQEGPLLRRVKPEGPRRLADIPQLEYCSALPT